MSAPLLPTTHDQPTSHLSVLNVLELSSVSGSFNLGRQTHLCLYIILNIVFTSFINQSLKEMAIKLYGAAASTATLRAKACLAEKELDYEFVSINMGNKEHKSPEFLSRNPFGQVPALEDGDLKLFESRAITQYLAHTYPNNGTNLIIHDPKKMAIVGVWIEVEAQKFDQFGSKLAWELAYKPMFGLTTDDAAVEEYEKKLEQVLDVYESRLSESKYLGGDCFTLADLHHLPVLKYLFGTKAKRLFDARPHVSAWAAEIQSRPAWLYDTLVFTSTNALRVKACLAEKELDYEVVNLNTSNKEHKSPEFLSRSPFGQIPAFEDGDLKLFEREEARTSARRPFGQVPALEDGDLKLFESRAITKYLALTYPENGINLMMHDKKTMAVVGVWIEVESQKFELIGSKLAWELAYKPMFGLTTDDAVVEENEKKLEQVLDVYESRLSESKYLGGDVFTLADLHHLPALKFLFGTKVKRLFDARSHVSAWAADIQYRPAWIKKMAIKLYGSAASTATLRAKACLAEKELDYEFVTVNMGNKEHKTPEFLTRNPFGQVPALEDGDLKLFESRAITQYLAHTYPDNGTNLIIHDPKKMAIVGVWIEVEAQKFDQFGSKLAWELAYKPMFGLTTDEAAVEEHEKKLEQVLDVYESRLSESKYLGGDCFTLADLHHLPVLKYLFGTKAKRLFDARPHVSAWAAEIQSRPAWVKATTA
uniref:glutathione transferase n=2 Tax=Helianthus annuus TaxID=4232 RepID=A0A251VKQ9_HELAN